MLVALAAVMPTVIVIPAVVVAIPIPIPRLGDEATGCNCDERQNKTALGDSLFICHICAPEWVPTS